LRPAAPFQRAIARLPILGVEMAGPWIQNSHAQMSQHQLDKVFFDGGLMNLQECTSLMTSTASETGTDSMGLRHVFTDDADETSNLERKQLDAESRAIFRKQFRKTQLCRFYKGSGCHMGPDCEFAHGREELQKAPDLRRTSICPRWMQGKCPHSAETCGFAHGANHLRRTIGFQSKPGDKNKVPGSELPLVSRYAGQPKAEVSDKIQVEVQRQQQATMQLHTLIQEQQREIELLKGQLTMHSQAQAFPPSMNSMPITKDPYMYIGDDTPKLQNMWQQMQLAAVQAEGDLVLRL